jgi:hypothetical protein
LSIHGQLAANSIYADSVASVHHRLLSNRPRHEEDIHE